MNKTKLLDEPQQEHKLGPAPTALPTAQEARLATKTDERERLENYRRRVQNAYHAAVRRRERIEIRLLVNEDSRQVSSEMGALGWRVVHHVPRNPDHVDEYVITLPVVNN